MYIFKLDKPIFFVISSPAFSSEDADRSADSCREEGKSYHGNIKKIQCFFEVSKRYTVTVKLQVMAFYNILNFICFADIP